MYKSLGAGREMGTQNEAEEGGRDLLYSDTAAGRVEETIYSREEKAKALLPWTTETCFMEHPWPRVKIPAF